jgi:hypothetical protein
MPNELEIDITHQYWQEMLGPTDWVRPADPRDKLLAYIDVDSGEVIVRASGGDTTVIVGRVKRKQAASIAARYFAQQASPALIPKPSEIPRVRTVPGVRLTSIARFLLSAKSFERFVAPVIADMQHEYVDAVAAGHEWHARWIALRGHFTVIPGWVYGLLTRAIERIFTA